VSVTVSEFSTSGRRRRGSSVFAHQAFAEWRHRGRRLTAIARWSPWALGDWIIAGERAFGERVDAVVAELGIETGEAAELARVAQRFPPGRRRRGLSFSHHAAVADLEPAEAERLLVLSEASGWTVKRLQREVRQARR